MKLKLLNFAIVASKLAIYGIFLQVFFISSILAADSKAQKIKSIREVHIEIGLNNATLPEVFQKIEDISAYKFSYDIDDLDEKVRINLKTKKLSIADILTQIAREASLSFRQVNQDIDVRKRETQGIALVEVILQDHTVTGKVTDEEGAALPGVNVIVKGTTHGTVTNIQGNYSIHISEESILIFSYVGYISEEVEVGNRSVVNIDLSPDTQQLEELVVVGYGTVKKSDLTGSVGSIKSEEINSTPALRLDQAIKGKVSGLQATATSSAPGAATSIRIRGSNSISANNEPLYVVDGFIGGFDLNDININNIESVEVLKDASATAIYGSRGSNGVILITTKRGSTGKAKITYDTYLSYQSPTKLLPVLNASEFAEFINESKGLAIYPDPSSLGEGTDWQEEVYRNNVPVTNHTISITGGNEKNKYYLSGNYFNQEGISIASNLKRYHFRLNTDHQLTDKLKIGSSLIVSRRNSKPGSFGTPIIQVAGWLPTLPVKDEEGNYSIQIASPELNNDNPVANALLSIDNTINNKLLGTLSGEYEIIEGLSYKFNLGSNIEAGNRQRYLPSTLYSQKDFQGTATINNSETVDVLVENTLNLNKNIGKLNINGLVGYTRQKITSKSNMVQTRRFSTDAFTYNNLGAGTERSDAGSNFTEEGLESYIFRNNYSFMDKYLFTVSARLDGASVFASNNKWGFFPSAAIAWRASEEKFIENLDIFNFLKVRASIGRLGNPGLEPGASLSRLSQSGNNYILGVNQDVVSGIAANTLGNPDLKWESTTQLDLGIDMGFFDGRLQATIDYYNKKTEDLLVEVPLLWLTSFDTKLSNFGSISNSGIELSITSVNIDSKEFTWKTNFNISRNRNKILELNALEGFILTNSFTWSGPSGILKEGEPIGTFYGLEMDGIWNSQEEIDEAGLSGFAVFPGGRRFIDLDGDGVISETEDRKIIGNSNPDFYGGISNSFSYKGFELYMYFSFVSGNDIYNETGRRLEQAFDNNVYAKFANRWTPDNKDTDVPSVEGIGRPMIISNSSFVEDGSFLRLQDIRLTYDIPIGQLQWIQGAQIYIAGNNLLLFDNYSGYDPEINRGFNNTRRGYDYSQDPTTKSYTIGLKFDF